VFIDIDGIEPGVDFVRVLEEQVAQCDVLLAVIGKSWTDARDETNARRLDNPADFVRIEITSALSQEKRVIPVLVGDARMPRSDELPDVLKPLATFFNGVWGAGLNLIIWESPSNNPVIGVHLNDTRSTVENLLGAPKMERSSADIYVRDGVFFRFDYDKSFQVRKIWKSPSLEGIGVDPEKFGCK
jgi:TIR domain